MVVELLAGSGFNLDVRVVSRAWGSVSLVIALVALWCAPISASAQSFYAFQASLAPDGVAVGRLGSAPVSITSWASPTQPILSFRGRSISLQAPVELGTGRTQIVVRVSRAIRISTSTAFEVTLRAGSHVPLLASQAAQLRIALPPGLPAREGLIPATGLGALSGRPHTLAFHGPRLDSSATGVCEPLTLYASPDSSAEHFVLSREAGPWIVVGAQSGGFTEVRVQSGPVEVRAFARGAVQTCDPMIGLSGMGSGCGDGASSDLIVELPPRTELYASADAAAPFARTRRAVIARAPRDHDPSAPIRWILSERSDEGRLSLSVYVRTPLARLRRAPSSVSPGFGGCFSPVGDWPTGL